MQTYYLLASRLSIVSRFAKRPPTPSMCPCGYCAPLAILMNLQQVSCTRVLNRPENYNLTDPARGFLRPNPTQPDTPAWIVCTNPAQTPPPCACIVFLIHLLSYAAASGLRLPLPMKQAARLTLHHTWTAMIHNKQYIIYNLQELCFMKCVL